MATVIITLTDREDNQLDCHVEYDGAELDVSFPSHAASIAMLAELTSLVESTTYTEFSDVQH